MECENFAEQFIETDTILETTEIKNSKKSTCFQCFTNFETNVEMIDHIVKEHFLITCDKCSKQFPTDKKLKKHLRDAHLTGKFPCPICDKIFTRKDLCKDHIYTHSEKPFFRCKYDNCGKVFRQSITLKQHERTHTGSYSKNCPLCNETVVQLSKHLNSHLVTKQHPCNYCEKSFSRRSYLVEHEKIHRGEEGFVCEQCKIEFKSSNALYKHKRSKHSTERYVCEALGCTQEFNRKDNMMSHMKRIHKVQII